MRNKILNEEIFNSLPEELKLATSNFTLKERDIVLLSSLAVISSLLPNVYGIYDRKKVYSNLYLLVIAPPASGKGVMNFSRGWANPIHDKILNESKVAIANYKKKEDRTDENQPEFQTKIIPANISSAELYSKIRNAHHGGLIIESEADTLSNMLKQDWGNFSDVLRNAFHHEKISISRKMDNQLEEVQEPRLSLVLSGTPNQIMPLVQSKGNGLFSRFIYYTFNDISPWKNVFNNNIDSTDHIKKLGQSFMYNLYSDLLNRSEELKFALTEEQQKLFHEEMSMIHDIVNNNKNKFQELFNSNLKRHGLILFRLCMILSVIRNYQNIQESDVLICEDVDFNVALKLTKILLHHADEILNSIDDGMGLSQTDDNILFSLKQTFFRKDAIEAAAKQGIPERTMDEKLKQWRKNKVVKKISHGKYQRR